MNFLAHIWLSGSNDGVRLGNFIGDAVRGKDLETLPDDVVQGVHLHRKIDQFVDHHPLFKHDLKLLRPYFGKYAPVGLDVLYDHYLAKHFDVYSAVGLNTFAFQFYQLLNQRLHELPPNAKFLSEKIIERDWLTQYSSIKGIGNIMMQMDYRSRFPTGFEQAEKVIANHEEEMKGHFEIIIHDLKMMSNGEIY